MSQKEDLYAGGKKPSVSRRRILKGIGVSSVGISGIGTVTASSGSGHSVNTEFDPTKPPQVREFAKSLFKKSSSLPEAKRLEFENIIKKRLTDKQWVALSEILKSELGTTIEHTRNLEISNKPSSSASTGVPTGSLEPPSDGGSGGSSWKEATYTLTQKATPTIFGLQGSNVVATHKHSMTWLYDGVDEIETPLTHSTGSGYQSILFGVDYLGSSETITPEEASFYSESTGKFTWTTGTVDGDTFHAYSRILGGPVGEHHVIDQYFK
ncbi:hypothetical protein U3A55_01680 [Salarchaeum sp. III]|uniref:hypothetical protein n=1 Tax=Salarchaeum sp. III TaxID=3107927 RepID=UPI002ED92ADD